MPNTSNDTAIVQISRETARTGLVLVCEHASNHIPPEFKDLGLSETAKGSHAAWDPGASAVANALSQLLDAVLVEATVSRLIYDCNRPPDALDAMPEKSEAFTIPGNMGLSTAERARRTAVYYDPFKSALAECLAGRTSPVLITIHSFTPVYHGVPRDVEIGILHDSDSRLADAYLETAAAHCSAVVARNVPYGPDDGVTHTLRAHAISHGHLNVMIEIRNDLIATAEQQQAMAQMLATWTQSALRELGRSEGQTS